MLKLRSTTWISWDFLLILQFKMTLSVYFKKSFTGMVFITIFLVLAFSNGCSGCGVECSSCSGISQMCRKCKNGYWLHNTYCQRCPENCEQCSNDSNCSKCKTGFYGTMCLQSCTLCSDGLCELHDGQCRNGCIDGYFEDTAHANKTCRKCSRNCKLCQSQGICSECDNGFYKLRYQNSVGSEISLCLPCIYDCEQCSTGNNCTICKPNTYGPLCQYNCSDSHCQRCNKADDVEKCTACGTGYMIDGSSCVPDITCSQNCVNGCDNTELCLGGCKDGWSGQTCTRQCASRCMKCNQENDKLCTECKGDFFTSLCTASCNVHCSKLTLGKTCSTQDGFCINGCIDGYWGNTCNKSCYEGCNSPRCNQTNGFCASCLRNYYGYACEHTCSEHCFDDDTCSINQLCRTSDGKCELGCMSGHSGDLCEYTMISTVTSISTSEKSASQLEKQDGSETKFYVLGFITGVGFSLMVAAGVGLFCCFRRRQTFTSETTNNREVTEDRGYENTTIHMRAMSSTETDYNNESKGYDQTQLEAPHVYERLQDNNRDDQQQYTELGGPAKN